MSFGDYTGLPTLTNTALSASAVTSNTQSDSSWLGKVWGGIKYFGEQYWDGLKTGRQRDKIYNWANSAGEFFNAEVSSFSKSGDEMLNSAYRGLDTFAKGGLGYLLDKSKDVETLVTKAYNQAVNNPGATFIDAPLNYLQSIPSRAETTWEIMKSSQGGEYVGYNLFNLTMTTAPLAKGIGLSGTASYLDDMVVSTGNVSNLATNTNEAVFWSGIRNGEVTAAKWASSNAGNTLESKMASSGIKLPTWNPNNPTSVAAWRNAAQKFAAGAKGNVRVLQGNVVRVKSVWAEVEFPALKANTQVKSIIGINPETGKEVLLWSR